MQYLDFPQQKTLADIGLDQFCQSPLRFSGSELNLKAQTMFEAGVPSNFIQDGDTIVRLNLVDGYLQSPDFVAGASGWRISKDAIESGSGIFRGDISAATGTFTGSVTIGAATAFDAGYDPILKVNTFAQDSIPTSIAIGDLWVDTNDSNKLYRAASVGSNEVKTGEWEPMRDTGIAAAISAASDAQATADGKVVTFVQNDAPTAEGVGDLWIDSNDSNKLYRWSGIAWVEIRDTGIASAISAASGAQSTANSKIISFFQTSCPTSVSAGDIWFDTDDNNTPYRATAAGDNTVAAGHWIKAENPVADWANVRAGTNAAALAVGDGKVLIDGPNKRIIINDGTNDRVLIGYLAGKF